MRIPRGPLPSGTGQCSAAPQGSYTQDVCIYAAACLERRATGIRQPTTSSQTASGTLGRKEVAPVAKQHRAAPQRLVLEC